MRVDYYWLDSIGISRSDEIQSSPADLVHVGLAEFYVADWAFTVAVAYGVLEAFFAEDVGAGLEGEFSLTLGTAGAHYFLFVFLHL